MCRRGAWQLVAGIREPPVLARVRLRQRKYTQAHTCTCEERTGSLICRWNIRVGTTHHAMHGRAYVGGYTWVHHAWTAGEMSRLGPPTSDSAAQQRAAAALTDALKTLTTITAAPTSPATSSTAVAAMSPISQGGELENAAALPLEAE